MSEMQMETAKLIEEVMRRSEIRDSVMIALAAVLATFALYMTITDIADRIRRRAARRRAYLENRPDRRQMQ